ncbi:MAG: DUF2911 domain-containing protein [Acidobacteria bacterium]|nr:DUF2911 domain-containing protein [Acidobacteriota bacterium]
MNRRVLPLVVCLLTLPVIAFAQAGGLNTPDASPAATVTQIIGLTELGASYHRPAVNGRQIWGGLVPYDQVWRAGADENTTVSFSTAVTVNGTKLGAGTYGLHMIPTSGDWTVIFSTESHAWGSFSYDQKEDAARIVVKPEPAPFQERLGYSFDDPTRDSAVLALRWEKLRVPLTIKVDVARTVLEDYKTQMRGLPRFGWQGWNQLANWAAQNEIDLDDAQAWADRSISMNRNFTNLRTKALVMTKKGNAAEAETLTKEAMSVATEVEVNAYGYQLLGQQKVDEAIAMFEKNVKEHPASWNVHDSLAEAYAIKGDKKKAIEGYSKALGLVKLEDQKARITTTIEGLKK